MDKPFEMLALAALPPIRLPAPGPFQPCSKQHLLRPAQVRMLHIASHAEDVALGRWQLGADRDIDLVVAANLADGLALLDSRSVDVVVCASTLVDASAAAAVNALQARWPQVPVVIVAEHAADPALQRALKSGADDFVIRGHTDAALIRKTIHQAIARRRTSRELEYLACHDKLTGLANRELFADRVQLALNRADRGGHEVAVLVLDLDRFRSVNEAYGHARADSLLIAIARRLEHETRSIDTVARSGSNEFSILIEQFDDDGDVARICSKLQALVGEPLPLGSETVFLTCSIGVAVYPLDAGDLRSLIGSADTALDQARRDGRNCTHRHRPVIDEEAGQRARLERAMRPALGDNQFVLRYQPKVNLQTGAVLGVEALVRWQHPQLGLLMPAQFIPLAEQSGFIVALGAWVIEQAFADLRHLGGGTTNELSVAINLSAQQFARGDLVQTIEALLERYQVDPNLVIFEITESTLMADTEASLRQLDTLKAMGVMVYLDDFGTGYSSLAYLKRFRIDGLKIDRSFIRDVPHGGDDVAIARAILALAHALQLGVVAEGVEHPAQLEFVTREGCDEAQGRLFSAALSPTALRRWLSMREI